ncbi:hypothetical protein B4U80_11935 [Leptotrombidium deliense]|uniref:Uncharacterized protein n=1 Tax=Leptotrombidium deliense TaxID=299467 RepID=A0A443S0N5_9ACAR|nr:hypothetical protein B4U80_11935 [Leptotrombidium deliense]
MVVAALCLLGEIFSIENQATQHYQAIIACMNKINYMYNDFASLEKEIKEKSLSNIIIVLKHERKYEKWQDAIDEAALMLKDELKNFELLLKLFDNDESFKRNWRIAVQCGFDHSFKSKRYNFKPQFIIDIN